jgi:hypothetical protein
MAKKTVNKMAMVRAVVEKHGPNVKPLEIKLLLEADGVNISGEMASTYKSAVLKKLGGKPGPKRGRPAGKAKAAAETNGTAKKWQANEWRANGEKPFTVNGADPQFSLEDIADVRHMVHRFGKAALTELAGVLA